MQARQPTMKSMYLVATLLALSSGGAALALSPLHPIIGKWTIAVPDGSCSEVYRFKPDGTRFATSGEEVAESRFEISPQPSAKGFYKMVDTIVRDNGKPDCAGEITPIGDSVTLFVHFAPSGKAFDLCESESMDACIGPFRRVVEKDI